MPSDPFTPAELEAAAAAVHQAYLDTCARLGWPVKPPNQVPYEQLSEESKELDRASVRAVAPLIAARVRAECVPAIIAECNRTRQATREQVADGIAAELREQAGREPNGSVDQVVMLHASEVARANRTTPTEEPS